MEFDYTTKATQDTLKPGTLQGYRLVHWLADVLRNWMSDPINIKDERLCNLLLLQDGEGETMLKAKFDVGTPYAQETTKACTTPMIIVSLGETQYPVSTISQSVGATIAQNGAQAMYKGVKYRSIACHVTVYTESYDGTLLLAGLIEDFLVVNEQQLVMDNGSISEFHVVGSTAPSELKIGSNSNAKPTYQSTISVKVVGGISWHTDTQGPVFRGVTTRTGLQ